MSEQDAEQYHDAGLALETEVYGFLDALGVTWSTTEVNALTAFIQGRINAERDRVIAETNLRLSHSRDT
jgi:hypothetical protein